MGSDFFFPYYKAICIIYLNLSVLSYVYKEKPTGLNL